jgi:hypothetical protein
MAAAVLAPSLPNMRTAPSLNWAKALVNAVVSHRVDQAARELRRHDVLIGEAALVHGDLRRISLSKADLLPFNPEA